MALKSKFLISWIVLSAVFISLSVSSTEQEIKGQRCHWCGPLAEQVHRSQRAPKCDGDRSMVTVCDDGLPYCAIVATSPPYAESRYCVKFYQDECYSLYCNTTKTWKITCPCRGELCNGVKTERENEAFETLFNHNIGKLAKNKRIKRSLMAKVGFIGLKVNKNKIDNVTTDGNKDGQNEIIQVNIVTEELKSDDTKSITKIYTTHDNSSNITETVAKVDDTSESQINETIEGIFHHDSGNRNTETSFNQGSDTEHVTETASSETSITSVTASTATNDIKLAKYNETQINHTKIDITFEISDHKTNESTKIFSSDLKTEIILMSSQIPEVANFTVTDAYTNVSENILNIPTASSALIQTGRTSNTKIPIIFTSSISETKPDVTMSKSREKLPTAEALLHNETPTTKATDQTFTTMNIKMRTDLSTQTTMRLNNSAVRVEAHIFSVIIGIVLYY